MKKFLFSKSVENSSVISASNCRGHNSISRHSTHSRILLQLQWSLHNLKPRSYVVLIQAKPSKQHWTRKSCTAWHCYCCEDQTYARVHLLLFVCLYVYFFFISKQWDFSVLSWSNPSFDCEFKFSCQHIFPPRQFHLTKRTRMTIMGHILSF